MSAERLIHFVEGTAQDSRRPSGRFDDPFAKVRHHHNGTGENLAGGEEGYIQLMGTRRGEISPVQKNRDRWLPLHLRDYGPIIGRYHIYHPNGDGTVTHVVTEEDELTRQLGREHIWHLRFEGNTTILLHPPAPDAKK